MPIGSRATHVTHPPSGVPGLPATLRDTAADVAPQGPPRPDLRRFTIRHNTGTATSPDFGVLRLASLEGPSSGYYLVERLFIFTGGNNVYVFVGPLGDTTRARIVDIHQNPADDYAVGVDPNPIRVMPGEAITIGWDQTGTATRMANLQVLVVP